jgi:hypothetical protein
MAKYMNDEDIQEYLQEGLEEEGTIEKAFDYLLENEIRDVFEMDNWDNPKFTEMIIPFNGVKYKVTIQSDGCCEHTNEHRIMYWKWNVNSI